MRNKIQYAMMFILMMAVSSCELEHSQNGKLDGFWHLEQIDSVATGHIRNCREDGLFWAIQGRILSVRKPYAFDECVMQFSHHNDSLYIFNPLISDREKGDIPLTEPSKLQPYGINQIDDRFAVESLTNSSLRLRSQMLVLHFKKF